MNSSSSLRKRRKSYVSCRKLNSIGSQSGKRRISILQKNNKALAVALQDARCELSAKQQFIENASIYFKNTMEARVKMLEMYSVLKSVMKNFDHTLLLLKVDDTKISDLTAPFKSYRTFKDKIKEIKESVEGVSEENSILIENENANIDSTKSSNPLVARNCNSSKADCMSVQYEGLVDKISSNNETAHDLPRQISMKNNISNNSESTKNTVKDPVLPVSLSENLGELINPNEDGEIISTPTMSLKDRKNSETPKLSISVIKPLIDFDSKKSSNTNICLLNEKCSSVVENPLKILKLPSKSSSKVLNSKIPRLHAIPNLAKKVSKLSDVLNKGKSVSQIPFDEKNLNILVESDQNGYRRKTFVVKNPDSLATDPESNVALNQEQILDENSLDIDQDSNKLTGRKTFVIKNSDTSEKKCKSPCDRRKTFVKKCDKINSRKSIKNIRDTFVLSEVKENCTTKDEAVTAIPKNLERDIIVQEKSSLPCKRKIDEALPSVSNDSCENTGKLQSSKNKLVINNNNSSGTEMMPSQNCSVEFNSQVKEALSEIKDCNLEKDSSNVKAAKESSYKSKKINRKVTLNFDLEGKVELPSEKGITPAQNSFLEFHPQTEKTVEVSESTSEVKESQLQEGCSNTDVLKQNLLSKKNNRRMTCKNAKKKIRKSETENILSHNSSKEYQFQGEEISKKMFESKPVHEESMAEKDAYNAEDAKESSFKAKISNSEETSNCGLENVPEVIDIAATCESNTINVIQGSCDDIVILDNEENTNRRRSCKRVSYKMLLDSSESDCESISELDLECFKIESSRKSIPIRGKVSKKNKPSIFSALKRKSALKKKSLHKNANNFKTDKNLMNECIDVPQSDNAHSRNMDANINTVENKIRVDGRKSVSFDFTNLMCKNKTANSTLSVIPCDRQEIILSNGSDRENMGKNSSVKRLEVIKQDNFEPEIIESKTDKKILSCNSPVIIIDKCLNNIESDIDNLNPNDKKLIEKQNKGSNSNSHETKPSVKHNKADKKSKVKKHSFKDDIPIDDIISIKENKSRKMTKKDISDLEKENVGDLLIKDKKKVKSKRQNYESKNKNKLTNITESSAIVVQAEVHPPPRALNILDSNIEKSEHKNFEVSVVLSDIFQSKNIDILPSSCKETLISKGRHCPLSDNSSNILALAGNKPNTESEEGNANTFQVTRTRRRIKAVNYAEPPGNKKMRR